MSLLEIFKAGTWTDMHGRKLSFSEDDIKATVDAYDPAVFRAPLVVGHPKTDDPAYGWVSALKLQDNKIEAEPEQVESQFAEMVNGGRFPKISASFFLPDSPNNPKPGIYYLRHVGFLGAAAPAVGGLKTASFGNADEAFTVEFANGELDARWVLSRFVRGMRDWFLSQFGQDTADRVVPDYLATQAENAFRDLNEDGGSVYAAPPDQPTPPEVTEVDPKKQQQQDAAFAQRETELKSREETLAAREAALQKDAQERRQAGIASFAEQLVAEGKVLPRDQDGLVAFMASLGSDTISFAAEEGTVVKQPDAWLRTFLESLPKQVDFAERGAGDNNEQGTTNFAAADGYSVDPDGLALHNKALAYQAQHKCDYMTAVSAVQ